MNMNRRRREKMLRHLALVIFATFAMTALTGPVRADHVEKSLGVLLGGVAGGAIGSTIGKGSGREAAIGVGSVLGALYGGKAAAHHSSSRHAGRHVHPRPSHVPATAPYHDRPVPVYVVQPLPVTPTPASETSITWASGAGSTIVRHAPASITKCRLLEGGLSPVYGCRDTNGNWRILR